MKPFGGMGQRMNLHQAQALVMTPQLRQAIKLLQSSNIEVTQFVEEELERNPLLERDERPEAGPDDGRKLDVLPLEAEHADSHAAATSSALPADGSQPLDADWNNVYEGEHSHEPPWGRGGRTDFEDGDGFSERAAAERTLREHLLEQVRLTFTDPRDRAVAMQFVALVDGAGRLAIEDALFARGLGCEVARVAKVRATMQRFDPVGMFCRSLRECLSVQLAEQNRLDPAMAALIDNLDMLARRDRIGLLQRCGVDSADLADMISEIRRLDPKPGAGWDAAAPPPLIPDVLLKRAPNLEWVLELNPETMPRVLVNRGFHARVAVDVKREDKPFLAEQLQTANWLVKSLEQRANTILKVAAEVVRRQDGFFRHGVEHLRPLILRDVAEAVGMHESTVSRVTANKHIATPRGIFELKYFFTTAIAGTTGETHSAEAVRHRIRGLIDAEIPAAILSDDAIVDRLRQEGVDIARRTVAKYRDALRIPSSVQRKREKAVPA